VSDFYSRLSCIGKSNYWIYDFLNDLTDWGFLEVEYSRPRGYVLQEPKQALMFALRRKEKQLVEVEKKVLNFANSLENIWRIERGDAPLKMDLIPTAEDFYLRLITMLLDAREAKFSKKTPSLILASERYTPLRRRYYNTLISRVNSNEMKIKYLFPLKPTLALVKKPENKVNFQTERLRKTQRLRESRTWLIDFKLFTLCAGGINALRWPQRRPGEDDAQGA